MSEMQAQVVEIANSNELYDLRSRFLRQKAAQELLYRLEAVREKKTTGAELTAEDKAYDREPTAEEIESARPISDAELAAAMRFMRQDRMNSKPQQRGKKKGEPAEPISLFDLHIPAKD